MTSCLSTSARAFWSDYARGLPLGALSREDARALHDELTRWVAKGALSAGNAGLFRLAIERAERKTQ